jgi:hypothetical protein
VIEWFDQNPLGQVGIIVLRDRLSEVLVPMGGELAGGHGQQSLIPTGNPQELLAALVDKRKLEPSGEPSLQNGLTMAKGGMRWAQPNLCFSDFPATCPLLHLSNSSFSFQRYRQPTLTGLLPSTRHSLTL